MNCSIDTVVGLIVYIEDERVWTNCHGHNICDVEPFAQDVMDQVVFLLGLTVLVY